MIKLLSIDTNSINAWMLSCFIMQCLRKLGSRRRDTNRQRWEVGKMLEGYHSSTVKQTYEWYAKIWQESKKWKVGNLRNTILIALCIQVIFNRKDKSIKSVNKVNSISSTERGRENISKLSVIPGDVKRNDKLIWKMLKDELIHLQEAFLLIWAGKLGK